MNKKQIFIISILLISIISIVFLSYFLIKNSSDYKTSKDMYLSQLKIKDDEKNKILTEKNKIIDDKNNEIAKKNNEIVSKSNILKGEATVTPTPEIIFTLPAHFGAIKIECIFTISYQDKDNSITNVVRAFYYPGVSSGVKQLFTISSNNKNIDLSGDGGGNIFAKSSNMGNLPIKAKWTAILL